MSKEYQIPNTQWAVGRFLVVENWSCDDWSLNIRTIPETHSLSRFGHSSFIGHWSLVIGHSIGHSCRLAILLLAALLTGCNTEETKIEARSAPQVQGDKLTFPADSPQMAALVVEPVEPCKGSATRLNGRLIWDDNVTVRVFTPFGGRVTKILAEVGQTVAQGDPLVWIASPDYSQAQADARKAASDFSLSERSLNRVRELFEHGAAPQKDLQFAEADFERAQSEKQRTIARMALYGGSADAIGDVYQLQSPLSGVVVDKSINPGQEVRPDQMLANAPQLFSPLFVITDPSKLWIQLDATEQDALRLNPGQPIVIHSRAHPDEVFNGQIEVISDYLDSSTRTIKVRGRVDNSKRLLKGEMFVSVELPASQQAGFDISTKAVFLKGEKHYIFLEEGRGQFARREIKIGLEHGGKVLVLDGVEPGQRVVTNGVLLLEQLLQANGGS